MARTVLAVDDDIEVLQTISNHLTAEGLAVFQATTGEKALELFERAHPGIVLLDLVLPTIDGYQVCQLIREQSNVPIIILSARGDEYDKIAGFRMGADDYITKPFSPRELALRVKAMLRRSGPDDLSENHRDLIKHGDLSIDHRRRTVTVEGREVQLTAREFDVLWVMASHPGIVYTREQLLCRAWTPRCEGEANSVTVLMSRLRNKLESDPSNPKYIETVWGIGYRFRD